MGIPAVGADLIITPKEQFALAKMAAEPLQTALLNANWLYEYHWPALVSVCPSQPTALGRVAIVVVPCTPSADGERYDFRTTIMPSNNTNMTTTVEYCTSYTGLPASGTPTVWTNIFTQVTAVTAATLKKQDKTGQTVPANAVALRFSVSVAAGTFELHHLLAFPHPTAIAAGVRASGFTAYDDGILSAADAPIHTEFLDRCLVDAKAVHSDRRQMVLSLCQDEVQANVDLTVASHPDFAAWPTVRAWLPYARDTETITVKSLITVDSGTTAARVRVAQCKDPLGDPIAACNSVTLDGSIAGAIDSETLIVYPQGEGAMRYVDLTVAVCAASTKTTYLHSLVAHWQPWLTDATAIQADPTPPAKMAYLMAADNWPVVVATRPYAGCAHLYRGGETGLTRRYWSMTQPAAVQHARYHVAVGFDATGGTAVNVSAATEQGGLAGNNPTKLYEPTGYTRNFDPTVQIIRVSRLSGDYINDTPTANYDRQLELEELLHPKIEAGFLEYACGHSVCVSRQSPDLEAL